MKYGELLALKIKTEGEEPQIRQMQEECGELIVALNHFCRGREGAIDEVIEELIDVEILLDQMKEVFPRRAQRKRIRTLKLARLAGKMGETYEPESWRDDYNDENSGEMIKAGE